MFFVQEKVCRGKLSFFHTLFLENEAQIDKNDYGMTLFMSKKVSLPKISSILQNLRLRSLFSGSSFSRHPVLQCDSPKRLWEESNYQVFPQATQEKVTFQVVTTFVTQKTRYLVTYFTYCVV